MTLEEAIIARLVAAATPAGSRIFREVIMQEPALPAIAVARTSGEAAVRDSSGTPLLNRSRVNITILGADVATTSACAAAVRTSLDNWKGITADVVVETARWRSDSDRADADGDKLLRMIVQDYEFIHR
ncbi:MAG: hypothetical protein RIR91_221 [Verrucomicrobiota bacterium]|jgi:hypothetical protein